MKMVMAPQVAAGSVLHGFIESLPQRFSEAGTLLYDERNVIREFDIEGQRVVVKRFRRPNWVQRVAYTYFCKGKARRAYEHGQELLRRGINTPQPLAYIELRSAGLLCDSYYVCGWDGHPPIADLLNRVEEFDRPLARDFALFAAQLHRLGILHHDLNSTNTLYERQDNGSYTFSVIDINRMDFYDSLPPLKECLENITRFTGNMQLFGYVAWFYADAMAADFGLERDELQRMAVERKERHDRRWYRRKRMLRKLKRLKP